VVILSVVLDGDLTVARALGGLGLEVMVTGLISDVGLRRDVVAAGLRESLFELAGERVSISDWADFVGGFYALAARASVVVLAGDLPDGLPDDAYAQLIRTTGTPVVLFTSGAPLAAAVAARPAVVVDGVAELLDAVTDWEGRNAHVDR
jgi:tagatose 6-phosphate kinase